MPVRITTESASDLSSEAIKEFDIKTVAMNVIIDNKLYKDEADINSESVLKTKSRLTTGAINEEEYRAFFSSLQSADCEIIHLSMSGKLSSTYQNACNAARSLENVRVIDSLSLSAGTALLCVIAAQLASMGESADKIEKIIKSKRSKLRTSFILEDLERMKKGGRCTALEALGANLLGIKPSVEVADGRLCALGKYHGKGSAARLKYIERTLGCGGIDKSVCFLYHSLESVSEVTELKGRLETDYSFERVFVNRVGCCTLAHCGRNCLGLSFLVMG